jgi:NAD(P)-dependent dehydrogenase (short-subunit alcohol dehydrogenase family)
MAELRFDGRTAIVTGAGGNPSLGRAHALLLAARGANVVVNDIGRDPETPGYTGTASAEAVAEEIRAKGGKAVASTHSVATQEGAAAIVKTALDAFGGVDILVNNAAIGIAATFEQLTPRDFQRHIDVNLMGPVYLCRAVWPHMKAKRYGRIVNTTSAAMAGLATLVAYSTSKGGLFSFTRALATEAAPHGIKVNAINPGAFTRMLTAQQTEESSMYKYAQANLPPDIVSPVIGYLAHESCPVTAECIDSVGGMVYRTYLAATKGFKDPALTIESVAKHWSDVMGGPVEGLVVAGAMDPQKDWGLKPYKPAAE